MSDYRAIKPLGKDDADLKKREWLQAIDELLPVTESVKAKVSVRRRQKVAGGIGNESTPPQA